MYNLIIVEDNSSVLELISEIIDFNELGFYVAGLFRNGVKALDFIRNNKVDVVITDIKMSEMDGTELAELLHEEFPEIKIIFLSAFRDFEYARSAVRNGVFDYLTKPIDIDEFNDVLKKVKKCLDKKHISFFSSANIFYKRQKAYEYIVTNKPENDKIIEKFQECGINIKSENPKIATIQFNISDFEQYLEKFWKHGFKKLYIALNNFLPQTSSSLYYLITKVVYDYFEVLVVCNEEKADFEGILETFKENFITNVKNFLNLDIKCLSFEFIPSLKSIAFNENGDNKEYKAQNEVVKNALDYIEEHFGEDISLKKLSQRLYVSQNYLSILFKKEMNMNFIDYLTDIRMKKAAIYLMESKKSIEEIYNLIGYSNKSHFYKVFKAYFGQTPHDYRNNRKKEYKNEEN